MNVMDLCVMGSVQTLCQHPTQLNNPLNDSHTHTHQTHTPDNGLRHEYTSNAQVYNDRPGHIEVGGIYVNLISDQLLLLLLLKCKEVFNFECAQT